MMNDKPGSDDVRALIEEAREWCRQFDERGSTTILVQDIIPRLADALEAASTRPAGAGAKSRPYCGDGSDHEWVAKCARCGYENPDDRATREWHEARGGAGAVPLDVLREKVCRLRDVAVYGYEVADADSKWYSGAQVNAYDEVLAIIDADVLGSESER